VRSLVNAIEKLGFGVEWVKEPADISKAEVRKKKFFFLLPINRLRKPRTAYSYLHRDLSFRVLVTSAIAYLSSLVVDILSPSVCIFSQTSRFWGYVWDYRRFLKALKKIPQSLAYALFLDDYKNSKMMARVFHKLVGIQQQP
jgi:hypothetical protein